MSRFKYKPISFYPELIKDWDYENNKSFSPDVLTAGSSKMVSWRCSICGHQWIVSPNSRRKGGCPKCDDKNRILKRIQEKGSFETNYPERAKDWDYEENGELLPSLVTPASNREVFWKCHICGYQWKGKVCNHAKSKYSCEKCSIRERALERYGERPLAETHPELAKEWDDEHNGDLTPYNTTAHYSKSVKWICKKGHRWPAKVGVRVKMHTGCPECAKELKTSFPEQAIYFYFKKITKAKNRFSYKQCEIDIFLKATHIGKVGIEYDGVYYHSSEKARIRDQKKDKILTDNGIRLIRVKESDKNEIGKDIIYVKPQTDNSHLVWVIRQLLILTGFDPNLDISIERDRNKIYEQYIKAEKANSLVSKRPDIAKQWDYEKNGNVRPEHISYNSSKRFYWKCEKGHSWPAQVYRRCEGVGCPYCAGLILVVGENDLLSQNPELAKQWDFEANGDLLPNQITVNNKKRVWWKCPVCHHHWPASVGNRNHGGGCPKCAELERTKTKYKHIIEKKGSFADNYPDLLKDWDYEQNIGIDPMSLPPHSGKTVYWKCHVCGHKWPTSIGARTQGKGCEMCYKKNNSKMQRKRFVLKNGSLAETHPHLIKDWNFEKNEETPYDYSAGSGYRAYWKCHHCGHEWPAPIFKRTKGHKCPKCHK